MCKNCDRAKKGICSSSLDGNDTFLGNLEMSEKYHLKCAKNIKKLRKEEEREVISGHEHNSSFSVLKKSKAYILMVSISRSILLFVSQSVCLFLSLSLALSYSFSLSFTPSFSLSRTHPFSCSLFKTLSHTLLNVFNCIKIVQLEVF